MRWAVCPATVILGNWTIPGTASGEPTPLRANTHPMNSWQKVLIFNKGSLAGCNRKRPRSVFALDSLAEPQTGGQCGSAIKTSTAQLTLGCLITPSIVGHNGGLFYHSRSSGYRKLHENHEASVKAPPKYSPSNGRRKRT